MTLSCLPPRQSFSPTLLAGESFDTALIVLSGKAREIHWLLGLLSVLFAIKFGCELASLFKNYLIELGRVDRKIQVHDEVVLQMAELLS